MMSELTRLHAEALRLLTIYEEHKDSDVDYVKRKAHVDLDRFLMEHRHEAIILVAQGLQDEIDRLLAESKQPVKKPWYKKFVLGGSKHGTYKDKVNQA